MSDILKYSYIIFLLLIAVPLYADSPAYEGTAVVVSKKIKPYMTILSGLKKELEKKHGQEGQNLFVGNVFFPDSSGVFPESVKKTLLNKKYTVITAIGPEAAEFVFNLQTVKTPRFYTGVLNPEKVTSLKNSCGLSLRIPVELQIKKISEIFPNAKNIGLLFSPENNLDFYEKASAAGIKNNLNIKPFIVSSSRNISKVMDEKIDTVDLLWMIPDSVVISKKIIYYIIKKGIYNNTGIIGYNSFFVNSGAVFSFLFDYEKLGIQTADNIEKYFKTGLCPDLPPVFRCVVNKDVAEKINLNFRSSECLY